MQNAWMHWEQLLENALYLSAWDEPCSCSISWRILVEELILYVEEFPLHRMTGKLVEEFHFSDLLEISN